MNGQRATSFGVARAPGLGPTLIAVMGSTGRAIVANGNNPGVFGQHRSHVALDTMRTLGQVHCQFHINIIEGRPNIHCKKGYRLSCIQKYGMKSISYLRFLKLICMRALFFLALLTISGPMFSVAQQPLKPRPSPLAMATAHYKNAYLKITYGQPQKLGREIFGKLVPFDQVWGTGANEATEITVTGDFLANGNALKAGTYSLFTIPGKEKWTIIFNRDLGLWGAYNYNQKMDVLRFDAPVKSVPEDAVYEPFTIRVDQKTDTAELSLLWDKTQV